MISSDQITTAAYTFLILGGLIAMLANIVVYLVKKSKYSKQRRR